MPEMLWAWKGEYDQLYASSSPLHPSKIYICADLVAEKDAEIERLRKALASATDTMRIAKIGADSKVGNTYVSNGYKYRGKEMIIETGYGETFVVSHPSDDPELAAYLKEKGQ